MSLLLNLLERLLERQTFASAFLSWLPLQKVFKEHPELFPCCFASSPSVSHLQQLEQHNWPERAEVPSNTSCEVMFLCPPMCHLLG